MKVLSLTSLAVVALSFAQTVVAADWRITDLPEANRILTCSQQTAYCANNCGGDGPEFAPMNFCNPKTMGWGCGCKIKKPDFPPYRWPVVVAECEGMKADCNAKCPQDNNINTCYTACTGKYLCNTDKAPPSYLQVSDVNATPAYTSGGTPAATGTNPTNAAGTGTSTSPTDTTKPNGASLVSAGLGSSVAALVAVAYMAL